MSTPSQIFAPLLSTNGANGNTVLGEKKRRRSRPYKARVSTKIRWALGDAMEKTISAQRAMREVLAWIDEQRAMDAGDAARLARLGQLDHSLFGLALDVSEIERIVTRAASESVTK